MQKPRELSSQFGFQSLETAQLLALVLRHGNRKQSVYKLSELIETTFSSSLAETVNTESFKNQLRGKLPKDSIAVSVICAVYEIALRNARPTIPVLMAKPENIAVQFRWLIDKRQEYLYGVYLNSRLQVIKTQLLAKGSTDMVNFEARDALYYAIKFRTRHFVLVHNHPSGDASPSKDDITITKKLSVIAKELQMELVDHIIIASRGYYSFRQQEVVL